MSKWRRVSLGEVADLSLGKMLDKEKNRGRPYPYLGNRDVQWMHISPDQKKAMLFEDHELERFGLRPGDVLVCEGGEAGRAAIWDGSIPEMKFQKALHRVRPSAELDASYFVYRLKHDYDRGAISEYYTGATIKHLTGRDLSRYLLPLPPLEEQRRIAAVLDRSARLVKLHREAAAKTRDLIPALFIDMFGDPATNPMGWEVGPITELASVDGGLQVTKARAVHELEFPYLRVANVLRGRLDLSEIKTIRCTAREFDRVRLVDDDVLVVEGHGNAKEIGRAALWQGEIPDCLHQNHLIRVRPKSSGTGRFLVGFLNSEAGRRELLKRAKTTSGLNTISTQNVRDVQMFLPPVQMTRRFAQHAAEMENMTASHDDAAEHAEELHRSLLAEVFGEA